MARFLSLKRLIVLLILIIVLTIFIFGICLFPITEPFIPKERAQKPMFRYQLEQELERFLGKKLTPQNGTYYCNVHCVIMFFDRGRKERRGERFYFEWI